MRGITSFAILSLTGLSQARSARFAARMPGEECCPCPAPGETGLTTVTVTQAAPTTVTETVYGPKETITVEKTITSGAKTVYLTQVDYPEPTEEVVTKIVDPATETIIPETPSGPLTVTVSIQPEPQPSVVTVTADPQSPVTKTIGRQRPGPEEPETVIVQPEPSIQTVTLENGQTTTKTIGLPAPVTVTAAPNPETVTQSVDHYSTVTQTVTQSGGDIDIQIIIINIDTGDINCYLEGSGLPCDAGSVTTDCSTLPPTTSITTEFNTVTVSGGSPVVTSNSTMGAAQPTLMFRKPRAPMSQRWW